MRERAAFVGSLFVAALATGPARAGGPIAPLPPPALVDVEGAFPGSYVEMWTGDDWKLVCPLPCRAPLDPRGTYRIDADGMRSTGMIRFRPGPQRLRLHAGTTSGFANGVVFTSIGGSILVTGLVLLAASTTPCTDCDTSGARNLGGVLGTVGLAIGVAGFSFLWRNRTSTVTWVDDAEPRAAIAPGLYLGPRGLEF